MKLQQNRSINEGANAMTMLFLKIATVTMTLALEPSLKIHQDIAILLICGKLNQNRSMNEGYRAMTMFFLKIATVILTLAYHNYLSNPESDL